MRPRKTTEPRLPIIQKFYQQQFAFVQSEEHFSAFVGGIGSGKSYAGCARALKASYGRVGTKKIPAPNVGMITAPTYPMLRDSTLRTFLEIAGSRVVDFLRSEMIAILENGSEILFRSADDPEHLRGPNISWWYGDEAALYTKMAWNIGIGRLRQFGRQGFAWLTTTPKGRDWIYKQFALAEHPDYRLIRARTTDNRYLDEGFVASLREAYAGDFALQELDAEFVAFEGLIYPEFDTTTHKIMMMPPRERITRVAAGVDWGYTNPGVILVGGMDSDGRLYLLHEEYQRKRLIEDWVSVAGQLRETWGVDTFFCDPAEPTYIDKFVDAGLYAVKADNTVNAGIQAVKSRLVMRQDGAPRLSVAASCANTLVEFEQYQWAEGRDGLRDQPMKANDHAMDALRYLTMGMNMPDSMITMGASTVL